MSVARHFCLRGKMRNLTLSVGNLKKRKKRTSTRFPGGNLLFYFNLNNFSFMMISIGLLQQSLYCCISLHTNRSLFIYTHLSPAQLHSSIFDYIQLHISPYIHIYCQLHSFAHLLIRFLFFSHTWLSLYC